MSRLFSNRLGWTLVAINSSILLTGIYLRGGFHSSFHLYHEPPPMWVFAFANFPAMIVAELIVHVSRPLHGIAPDARQISGIEFITILFASFVQWYSIGLSLTFLSPNSKPADLS